MYPRLFILAVLLFLFTSCSRHLVSPLNTISNAYIPNSFNPENKGSTVETYVGANFATGPLEEYPFYIGEVNVAQARSIRFLRVNYAAGVMMGSVDVSKMGSGHITVGRTYLQANGGNLFSGAVGGRGSISFVIPRRGMTNVEWRVLGCQLSAYRDFGEFSRFRHDYPASDTIYDFYNKMGSPVLVDRNLNKLSAGLFTEFEVVRQKAGHFGFRLATSFPALFGITRDDLVTGAPFYISTTLFGSVKRYHFFLQTNFGASDMFNLQTGVCYQISSRKKK